MRGFLNNWYEESFRESFVSINEMIKMTPSITIESQVVDDFKKARYLKTSDNFLIPLFPIGFDRQIKVEKIDGLKLKSLPEYVEFYGKFHKSIINDKKYAIRNLMTSGGKIIGITLRNDMSIPVKPAFITNDIDFKLIKGNFDFDINKILFKNKSPEKDIETVEEDFETELYTRFKYELSNYFINNEKKKSRIQTIIDKKNSNMTNKENTLDIMKYIILIKKIINEIYNDIVNDIDKVKLTQYLQDESNIRNVCHALKKDECALDAMCSLVNDKCRLGIPKHKKDIFINMISEEILINKNKSEMILNNRIDKIKNKELFVNTETNMFRKKTVDF